MPRCPCLPVLSVWKSTLLITVLAVPHTTKATTMPSSARRDTRLGVMELSMSSWRCAKLSEDAREGVFCTLGGTREDMAVELGRPIATAPGVATLMPAVMSGFTS